jgi:SAM-dependent methyltransferase
LLSEVYLEGELNFHATSICSDCLFSFRSISPSLDWFKKCWSTIATGDLEVFNPEVETVRRRRYSDYHSLLAKHIQSGRCLDVGAAYGTGSQVFQEIGYQVETLEPEDDKANYIRNFLKIPVFSGSLQDFPTPKEPFDLVIFAHCLEHLDDPKSAVAKIRQLMKPDNGVLYLEIPIVWNFVTWSDALYMAHKSNFTEENIYFLLAEFGFQVLETTWFHHASPDEPFHLGIVAKPVSNAINHRPANSGGGKHTVDEVKELFRKEFPLENVPSLDKTLRYSVRYIEQFYSTLRLDSKKAVAPANETGYILFEPASN